MMNDSRINNSTPHPVRSDHPLPIVGEGNSIERQSGRFEVKFPGQMEMVPIEMRHVWEEKRDGSCQFLRTAATCETPNRGRKAQRLNVVGPFCLSVQVVRGVPSRRPRSKSQPRSGRILSIGRAPRGGGRVPLHRTFTVERAGGVHVQFGRPTLINRRFMAPHNEVHPDTLFGIVNAPNGSPNLKGFLDSVFARTCLYKCS